MSSDLNIPYDKGLLLLSSEEQTDQLIQNSLKNGMEADQIEKIMTKY
jgi:hypothetical protein